MKNGHAANHSFDAEAIATLCGDATQSRSGWWNCICPVHEDSNPSFGVKDTDGGVVFKCLAGCTDQAIMAALEELKAKWNGSQAPSPKGQLPNQSKGCTLAAYAKAKKLAPDFLRELGVKEVLHHDAPALKIRYYNTDGKTAAVRYRIALHGEDKFRWRTGDRTMLYGLDRLDDVRKAESVFLVEGESDCQTLWSYDLPAVGVPGAATWDDRRYPKYFDGIDKIFVVIEPDTGGANLLRTLAESELRDRIRIIRLDDYKDVSELHVADPAQFEKRLLTAIDKAKPLSEDDANTDDTPPEIAELNETYALVLVGDKAVVLKESPAALSDFTLLSLSAFRSWHANRFIPMGKKSVRLADYWLEHEQRRQYEGIVFAPENAPSGHYNLWHGFAVEPKPGDCSKFLDHIRDNVCRGREAWYQWVIGWFAEIVQHPAQKSGTSLVIRGEQGTGKTIVGDIVGSLLGSHHVKVADPRYITGRFNSHLASCLLLHADEGFWAGDRAAEGKLKDLVTGTTHLVEHKGKEPFKLRNYVRLLVTGNPEWVVPAGMEERRFAVLEIGKDHQKDHPYFRAICEEMEHGGRAALLHYLLHVDLKKVDLRTIPQTKALLDQKLASLTAEQAWWLDLLQDGQLPGNGGEEPMICKSSDLFDDYIKHADKTGVKRRRIETQVGMYLRKVVPNLRKLETEEGVCYEFPSLRRCRERFCDLIDHNFSWSLDAEWTTRDSPKSRFDRH